MSEITLAIDRLDAAPGDVANRHLERASVAAHRATLPGDEVPDVGAGQREDVPSRRTCGLVQLQAVEHDARGKRASCAHSGTRVHVVEGVERERAGDVLLALDQR